MIISRLALIGTWVHAALGFELIPQTKLAVLLSGLNVEIILLTLATRSNRISRRLAIDQACHTSQEYIWDSLKLSSASRSTPSSCSDYYNSRSTLTDVLVGTVTCCATAAIEDVSAYPRDLPSPESSVDSVHNGRRLKIGNGSAFVSALGNEISSNSSMFLQLQEQIMTSSSEEGDNELDSEVAKAFSGMVKDGLIMSAATFNDKGNNSEQMADQRLTQPPLIGFKYQKQRRGVRSTDMSLLEDLENREIQLNNILRRLISMKSTLQTSITTSEGSYSAQIMEKLKIPLMAVFPLARSSSRVHSLSHGTAEFNYHDPFEFFGSERNKQYLFSDSIPEVGLDAL